jgi:hypothetical protein
MSGTDNQESIEFGSFDLADFIGDHSELFVVMGVFGALAIYISQSASAELGTDANLMIKTGFVSAFGVSILRYALIYRKLIGVFGDWNALYRAHFRLKNAPLAVFSLFSALLVLSLSFMLTQHEPVVFLILLVGAFAAGAGIVTRIVYGVARRVPRTPTWRISTGFLASLGTLLASMWLRQNVLARVEPTTIQNMSLSDPGPVVVTLVAVLVASIQSLAAIGVIASVLGIPVVLFDKIRGKSPYDEADGFE